jgi:hypothetical protein
MVKSQRTWYYLEPLFFSVQMASSDPKLELTIKCSQSLATNIVSLASPKFTQNYLKHTMEPQAVVKGECLKSVIRYRYSTQPIPSEEDF